MLKRLLSISVAAAISALAFQVTAIADEGAKKGGTLLMAIQNTPRHLNPAVQSGIATGEPGTQLLLHHCVMMRTGHHSLI